MIALLPVALALLAVPATAAADTWCVNPATGCMHDAETSIQTAFNDVSALDHSGSATIQLGSHAYSEDNLQYSGSVPLTINGAGRAVTSITNTGSSTSHEVLFLNAGAAVTVTVAHLALVMPAVVNWAGLGVGSSNDTATVNDVSVTAPAGATAAIGIFMNKGSVSGTTITLGVTSRTTAIQVTLTGAPFTVSDSTLDANSGVDAQGTGTATVHRTRADSGQGGGSLGGGFVVADPATLNVDDSLVTPKNGGAGLFASAFVGSHATINARQVTVVGDGSPGVTGIDSQSHGTAGSTATVNASDLILRSLTNSAYLSKAVGTSAAVQIDYSDLNPAAVFNSTGATFTAGPHDINADPLFAGASDFHLLAGSPAANRDPTAQQAGESSTDLDGNPRFAAGTGRDMGAYQQQPPTASAGASPSSQPVNVPFTFTGSGSDPTSGSTLAFSWAFDDGASASGATVTHAFAAPGSHSATLTVTDTAGRTGTATATVTVTAVIPPPPPLPDLEGFTLTNRVFAVGGPATPIGGALTATVKRGTTFEFRINTAAAVTLTFQRALPGRRAGRSCLPPRRQRRGHHDKPCTRYVGMGHINRSVPTAGSYSIAFSGHVSGSAALPVGKYHASLGAANATGPATPRTTSFTIVAVPKKHKKRGH
jgi:PKD domain